MGRIVDRRSGAQPDRLAAPIPRPFLVVANLLAALVASGLQLAALGRLAGPPPWPRAEAGL